MSDGMLSDVGVRSGVVLLLLVPDRLVGGCYAGAGMATGFGRGRF